jgi:hypothetical protein
LSVFFGITIPEKLAPAEGCPSRVRGWGVDSLSIQNRTKKSFSKHIPIVGAIKDIPMLKRVTKVATIFFSSLSFNEFLLMIASVKSLAEKATKQIPKIKNIK